ncbi:hypothetical protein A3F00_03880 [Candidatus Daviesbacteria bacterium RIFCSPHIGHO2_12_FULL_37_11]|uniref:Uncharacterized protein n=1 Tax=Candidatus Daviesbacteria bacterium RIFCSPHIGHO2_12_FULL_37_11 TaxID=1797777 RepID=A0A1F5KBM9_9BACT|nr:MAG: hypothetical protein A3F00_03880 [Candidatus Daviesbacteria bacterium RIFCSPHIGHO2_12_FULL_37_11]OGE45892.1 MAG: hypothetical protein A3B39_01665 [Candidatus Daviesbacteria bacterium RIFCSPLOWO2_01_FULL_37_10]
MKKEILLNFYSKNRMIIYPVTVGMASLLLTILVIVPQIRGYFSSKADESSVQNKIRNLEIKAAELESIPDEDLRRKAQFAVAAFPSEKDYTSIIGFLQRLSIEAGVNLESVNLSPGGDKNSSGVSNFTVKIVIKASSLSFDEFLKKIETSQTLLKIGGLSVEKSSDEQISVSLDIDVYFAPIPKTLGSVDSPLQKLTEDEETLVEKLVANAADFPAAPVTSGISQQPTQPVNLLPRGKVNPFE